MIGSSNALKHFGTPSPASEGKYMTIWNVPADIQTAFSHVRFSALGTVGFPKKIYCNKALKGPLETALRNLIARGVACELKTWDGCFIVRNARGLQSYSMHSWGLAVDVNASENRLGHKPILSAKFVKCWTDAGLVWGGTWTRPDGMHFELAKLP